jgi:hypothetical protein
LIYIHHLSALCSVLPSEDGVSLGSFAILHSPVS